MSLNAEQRRALELLASSRHGANEELLVLCHGFSRRMLAGLVRRKLAAAEREVVKAGGKTIEVARVRMNGGGATSARKPERQPRMSATQKFQELIYTMRPQDSSRRRRWDAIRDRRARRRLPRQHATSDHGDRRPGLAGRVRPNTNRRQDRRAGTGGSMSPVSR